MPSAAAGVVAELEQALLQVDDVVAADRPLGVVAQQPVAERPARLVEARGRSPPPPGRRPTARGPAGSAGRRARWRRRTRRGLERSTPSGRSAVVDGAQRDGVERPAVGLGRRAGSPPRRPRLRSAARTSATAGPRSPSLRICIPLSVPIVCRLWSPPSRRGPAGGTERDGPARPAWTDGPVRAQLRVSDGGPLRCSRRGRSGSRPWAWRR